MPRHIDGAADLTRLNTARNGINGADGACLAVEQTAERGTNAGFSLGDDMTWCFYRFSTRMMGMRR